MSNSASSSIAPPKNRPKAQFCKRLVNLGTYQSKIAVLYQRPPPTASERTMTARRPSALEPRLAPPALLLWARRGRPAIATVPQSVIESADITAITQLVARERESRDLGLWERMRTCFWPDSHIRVSWFRGNGADFVTGSIDMARRGVPAKHRLGPILVTLNDHRAIATTSAIIDLPVQINGTQGTLSSYTRFLYRAEKRSDRWGIISFDAVYVRDELTPSVPGQLISIDPKQLEPFRPTYRLLAYYLQSRGYVVDSKLAGEDLPETVTALQRELFAWADLDAPR